MDPQAIGAHILTLPDSAQLESYLTVQEPHLSRDVVLVLVRQAESEKYKNAQRALEISDIAQTVATRLTGQEPQALALWSRANALYHLSRHQEALDAYDQVETLYTELAQPMQVIGIQINRVAVLQDMGEYQAALTLTRSARLVCGALGPQAQGHLAILEMNAGSAYQQLGELDAALAAYDRGREILVRLGDGVEAARMDINRANVLQEMERFSEAEELFQSSRAVLAEKGHNQEVARADRNLGRLAHRRGQYQLALRRFEDAHTGFAAIPNPNEVALVDLHRSYVYRDLNLAQETIALARDAFRLSASHWDKARALMNQSIGYQRLGLYGDAAGVLDQARQLMAAQGATSRLPLLDMDRAELALAQGDVAGARILAQQLGGQIAAQQWPRLAAQLHLLQARCKLSILEPADNGEAQTEIHAHIQQALELAYHYHLAELGIQGHHLWGQLLESSAAWQDACEQYEIAVQSIEELRSRLPIDEFQMGFMENKLPIYADMVRLSHRTGSAPQVLYALNLAASAPLSHLAYLTTRPADDAPQDQELRQRMHRLREQWFWQQSKLEESVAPSVPGPSPDEGQMLAAESPELQRNLGKLEEEMAELNRRWRIRMTAQADVGPTDRHNPDPAKATAEPFVHQLQHALTPDQALLHYYIVEGQICLALTHRDGVHLFSDLAPAQAILRLLKSWRFHLEHVQAAMAPDSAVQVAQQHLHRLYGALLASAQPLLTDKKRLYVILPPGWHDLPLAALTDGRKALVQTHELIYLSAPEVLLRDRSHGPRNPIAQAEPGLILGYSDGGRLQHTPTEARRVAAILAPSMRVQILVEAEATLQAFQAACRHSALIHLATHAVFRPDNPLFSWIRLADARLTVADLYDTALPGRPLVVLSACETGRGQPRGGGLLGMGRGFLAAGASGLVVSLWKVADQPSAQLMERFYHHLVTSGGDAPAQALAAAQRAMLAETAHPFFWAGFVYIQG